MSAPDELLARDIADVEYGCSQALRLGVAVFMVRTGAARSLLESNAALAARCVPREPTEAMSRAGRAAWDHALPCYAIDGAGDVWRAMYDRALANAAPVHPAVAWLNGEPEPSSIGAGSQAAAPQQFLPTYAELRAANAALAARGVPREPTEAMLDAAEIGKLSCGIHVDLRTEIWRAMYDAALASQAATK